MFSFIPREGKFFDLFEQLAVQLVNGSHELVAMLKDPAHFEARARNIKAIESKGDEVTHATVELLHKTFITPLDRDDIHRLVSRMDDILDYTEAASQRLHLYGISKVPPETIGLAETCVKAVERVQLAVRLLKNLKEPEHVKKICVEINQLENEADHELRIAMAKLFREEPDTRELIKLKEIYELLETVTDRCEDVANVIEGIVLENS